MQEQPKRARRVEAYVDAGQVERFDRIAGELGLSRSAAIADAMTWWAARYHAYLIRWEQRERNRLKREEEERLALARLRAEHPERFDFT